MNRSKKKQAHQAVEQQAVRAMLEHRDRCSYSELRGLFKGCFPKGRSNLKRPELITQMMQSCRLRRKLRGGQWRLYVRPCRVLFKAVIDGAEHTRWVQDISFTTA